MSGQIKKNPSNAAVPPNKTIEALMKNCTSRLQLSLEQVELIDRALWEAYENNVSVFQIVKFWVPRKGFPIVRSDDSSKSSYNVRTATSYERIDDTQFTIEMCADVEMLRYASSVCFYLEKKSFQFFHTRAKLKLVEKEKENLSKTWEQMFDDFFASFSPGKKSSDVRELSIVVDFDSTARKRCREMVEKTKNKENRFASKVRKDPDQSFPDCASNRPHSRSLPGSPRGYDHPNRYVQRHVPLAENPYELSNSEGMEMTDVSFEYVAK